MDALSLDELLDFANRLADEARPLAMAHFRQPLAIETKADRSPVTIADRAIEARLREMIGARYPDHAVFGEEFASEVGDLTWVVDPIDGTRSFISGMPLFGTLIALVRGSQPLLGVIDFPAMQERWCGAVGRPSTLDGQPARTSARTRLADARCYATAPDMFTGADLRAFQSISAQVSMQRFGGDCYAYALLASGHVDLVVEAGLQPYDYLPLVAVVEGAGGRISDWQGRALGFGSDGRVVAAATEPLWRQCLDCLAANGGGGSVSA